MQNKKSIWFLFIILSMAILLSSCDSKENHKDLKDYLTKLKQSATVNNKQGENTFLKLPALVTFNAGNLREPFAEGKTQLDKKTDSKIPLQRYPLSMLKLMGVLSKNGIFYAYILAPDNIVYQVKIGDVIGDHYGKIEKISPNRLEISEQDTRNGKPGTGRIVNLQLKDEQ